MYLPKLPKSLDYLFCDNNNLTRLPELPSTLKYLYCFDNQLKELPELPVGLNELWCSSNQLKELPELPNTLRKLICSNNKLPFNNLKEYKKWRVKDPDLTLKEKYRKYHIETNVNRFNL